MLSRMFIVAFALACLPVLAPAQASNAQQQQARDQAKLFKESLSAAAAEAAALKLPENRALLQASLADLLWPFDEPGARALIQEAQAILSRPLPDSAPEHMQRRLANHRQQLRGELVKSLARRDAQLALDFLRATRPISNASEAIAKQEQDHEAYLEQQLALEIARHDPARALRLAEESLEKGLSYELHTLLATVLEKDRAAGEKLIERLRSRLQSTDLVSDQQAAQFALSFISEEYRARRTLTVGEQVHGVKQRPPALSEQSLREWNEMMARAALAIINRATRSEIREQYNYSSLLAGFIGLLPEIEKSNPAAATNFRRVYATLSPKLSEQVRESIESNAITQNGKAEELLALAAQASGEKRENYVRQAIFKAVGIDADFELARKIANEHISDPQRRKSELAFVESIYTQYAAGLGKIDEVINILASLDSDEARADALTDAAEKRLKKGDRKLALDLLEKAFGFLPAELETHRQFRVMSRLVRTLAPLDVERAFTLYESLLEPINQIAPAYIKSCRYNADMGFCLAGKDELYIRQGVSDAITQLQNIAAELQVLAGLDFERALALADRFRQNELRLYAKLSALRGLAAQR